MRFKLTVVMIVGGVVLAGFGVYEGLLALQSSAQPQFLTCQELIEDGPGGNRHVTMGDYLLCDWAFVYEVNEDVPDDWTNIWVPAVPLGGPFHQRLQAIFQADPNYEGELPTPKDYLIVSSREIEDERQLIALAQADVMQGMVVSGFSSLGSEEKRILTEQFPGIEVDGVQIFQHGRRPFSQALLVAMIGGGLVLVLAGGLIGAWPLISGRRASSPLPASQRADEAPEQPSPQPAEQDTFTAPEDDRGPYNQTDA